MNTIFIIFIFITKILLFKSLSSDEIWKKTKNYIKQGKMIVNENKTHFIFDEYNYTGLDINSTKMQTLYKRQEQIYKDFKITNYIFIVDNLDEIEDKMPEIQLEIDLEKDFHINIKYSIILFLSVKTERVTLRFGHNCPRVTIFQFEYLILKYMREKKFYEDLRYIINDFYDQLQLYQIVFTIQIIIIIIILLMLVCCCLIIICKQLCHHHNDIMAINYNQIYISPKLPNDKNLKKIVMFLRDQKNNEEILNEYCSICLEKFNNKEKEIRGPEDLDSVTLRLLYKNEYENENIDILLCGHKFHSNCISKLKISDNDCPLCKQKNNNKYNNNEKYMIWGVQNDLNHNAYKEINYSDLFIRDFEDN